MLTPISSSASRVSLRIARLARNGSGLRTFSRRRNMLWKTDSSSTARGPGRRCRSRARGAWSTLCGSYGSPRRNICPPSGFWKPQMIFISVDLPAPLSPSSPSTSPLRRCRLMSRSAVTGPKRLATCSTRRTSSAAAVGATTCSPVMPVSANAGPLSHPADVRVGGHRDDDRQAQVEAQVVGVDALDDQAVAAGCRGTARRSARRRRCPSRRPAACRR